MSRLTLSCLAALALLPACAGGPLVGPALEMQATRAALQASLNSEGEVEPPRGDALALDIVDPDRADAQSLELWTPESNTPPAPAEDVKPSPEQDAVATATTALGEARSPADRDDLARSLDQLTREMSEQRMLMMMQMFSGRSDAPVAVDSSGRLVDLSVTVQRLQDAQGAQSEQTTAILAELQALSSLLDERVPADTTERLAALQHSADAVPPALDEIRAAQEALARRVEALEALHREQDTFNHLNNPEGNLNDENNDDDGSGDADDTRGEAIPLFLLMEEDDTQDAEQTTDTSEEPGVEEVAVTDEPVATDETFVTDDELPANDTVTVAAAATNDPTVQDDAPDYGDAEGRIAQAEIDRAEADRIRAETRIAERLAKQSADAERRAARQERRLARRDSRSERAAEAADREAELAARYSNEPDDRDTVAIVPVVVPVAGRDRRRGSDGCVDTSPGPDGVRFGLDMRATRRLARLLDNDAELVDPPAPVPLPPVVTCDPDNDDA